MNELYKKLLQRSRDRLLGYVANARIFENQFDYDNFNDQCFEKMWLQNDLENPKSVKTLKEEIPSLKPVCKNCGAYFMDPRNKSLKGLDVNFGRFLEDQVIDFLNRELKIKAVHADTSKKAYPDCMILKTDNGILAYFEVKYHGAPFILAKQKTGRDCYEGSITLDLDKIAKQLELIESELDRPTFFLHWIDYPCLKGIFFETSEQVKCNLYRIGEEFDRKERAGDFKGERKVGYTKKFYSPLLAMGTFEEFVDIIKDVKRNGLTMN
ncbi:MAG: hypothetical protein ACXV5H_08570 [Halobacteriota archaeon]